MDEGTIARFWEKVEKRPDGCWVWTGRRDKWGYGLFGRSARAHRVSYAMNVGEIPDGLKVCHHCDNPSCVRPDHLFLGTIRDNVADCIRKGRFSPCIANLLRTAETGEGNPKAKLTEADVRVIRQLASTHSRQSLADRFGVSRSAVRHIVAGDTWRHV